MAQKIVAANKLFSNQDLSKLFLPVIIEQFLEYLVGLADSIMVAHVAMFIDGIVKSAIFVYRYMSDKWTEFYAI